MFLQIKEMKQIEQEFFSDAWVIPQGWAPGCPGGSKIFTNMVMWHIKLTGMKSRTECKILPLGQTGSHGVRSKGQISLNFN